LRTVKIHRQEVNNLPKFQGNRMPRGTNNCYYHPPYRPLVTKKPRKLLIYRVLLLSD
jgi:hypothetical protein